MKISDESASFRRYPWTPIRTSSKKVASSSCMVITTIPNTGEGVVTGSARDSSESDVAEGREGVQQR
jgi:hypothetical protein